ncbi:lethal (2) giant discs 1 isoform X2 [Augochlora pura]
MFGKKEKPKRQTRPAGSLAQYGIFEVPETFDNLGHDFMGDDDNDDDLEAELAALTVSDDNQKPRPPRKPISNADLDAMIAQSLKDPDEDTLDEDGELSDNDDDPELLNELKMITGDESDEEMLPTEEDSPKTESAEQSETGANSSSMDATMKLLEDRLRLYQIAEKKAKQENESSRARRYMRGIQTLKQLLTDAKSGKPIDEGDIPPQLPPSAVGESTEKVVESPKPDSTEEKSSPINEDTASTETNTVPESVGETALTLLKSRQLEYKKAALVSKKANDMPKALQYMTVVKQFDIVIAAVNAGEAVDLSDMPPSPNMLELNATAAMPELSKVENETQGSSSVETASVETAEAKPAGPENLELALKERLEVYRRSKTTAETENNASKARRYGRICKQFEDALKLHARGKSITLDELPVPPGFPPLVAPAPEEKKPEVQPTSTTQETSQPEPSENAQRPKVNPVPTRNQIGKKSNQKITRADKQSALLQQRQRELKQAALDAKKEGDLELARNYLRQAKGIDPLIEASIAGLPVDMNTIPLSPLAKMELNSDSSIGQLDESFELVNSEHCREEARGTDDEIYENLDAQLVKQMKWCLNTREHSKALGDVSAYNKWERFALDFKRDLDMLRVRKRAELPPPQHHYEIKTYAIVQSCTDLNNNDVEISIMRGINYSKEDTYVIYEFPYPTDNPPTDRTSTVRGTCNPEYEAVFRLSGIIDRGVRQCQRAFKRHALKCQVWAKGCSLNPLLCCTNPSGFFRSDSLLGTATVKLQPLESKCIIHDSFPLMDGRKATGAKLELKIRLRSPVLTKQIEQVTDKWLIIDH